MQRMRPVLMGFGARCAYCGARIPPNVVKNATSRGTKARFDLKRHRTLWHQRRRRLLRRGFEGVALDRELQRLAAAMAEKLKAPKARESRRDYCGNAHLLLCENPANCSCACHNPVPIEDLSEWIRLNNGSAIAVEKSDEPIRGATTWRERILAELDELAGDAVK